MSFAPSPPPVVSLAVTLTEAPVTVGRTGWVCRNHEKHVHATNKGADPRDPPFLAQKRRDAVVREGATIPFRAATDNLRHDIEPVASIGTGGAAICVWHEGAV